MTEIKIEVIEGPEKRGWVITSYDGWELTWVIIGSKLTMISKMNHHRGRICEPEHMVVPDNEYQAHQKKAFAVFQSRKAKKVTSVAHNEPLQPRLPI